MLEICIWIFHLTLVNLILLVNGNLERSIPFIVCTGCFQARQKVTWRTRNTGNFRCCFNSNIRITFDFSYKSANCRLFKICIRSFGWELFCPAKSFTAKDIGFFNNSDLVAGLGGFPGSSQTGKTTTHHYDISGDYFQLVRLRHFSLLGLNTGHTNVVCSHFIGILVDGLLGLFLSRLLFTPGSLLSDVTANSNGVIAKIKFILHYPAGTCTDNKGIHTIIFISL